MEILSQGKADGTLMWFEQQIEPPMYHHRRTQLNADLEVIGCMASNEVVYIILPKPQ